MPPLTCPKTDIMSDKQKYRVCRQQNLQNLDHQYREKVNICKL